MNSDKNRRIRAGFFRLEVRDGRRKISESKYESEILLFFLLDSRYDNEEIRMNG